MPYSKLKDLPESVQSSLPKHAQEIYKEGYNNAYDEYDTPKERRNPDETREEVAHKVAWSAVKRSYVKNSTGEWIRKD